MPSAHQMWLNNYRFPGEEPGWEEPGWEEPGLEEPGLEELLTPEQINNLLMEERDSFVGPMPPVDMPIQGLPPKQSPAMGNPDKYELVSSGQFPGDMGPSMPATTTTEPNAIDRLKEAQPVAEPGKHPFLLDMENRERKRRTLEGYRNISEGLSRAGAALATTPGGILTGHLPQAYKDEGIRKQQARFEDEVPAGMLDAYNRMYFPDSYDKTTGELTPGKPSFPEGTTMSQIKGLAGVTAERARAEREKGINSRFDVRQNLNERRFERLDRPDRDVLSRSRFLVEGMKTIASEYEAVKEHFGPVSGRVTDFLSKLGAPNPQAAKTGADVAFQVSQFIYLMTGKQMNEQEMIRLEKVMPGPHETAEVFMSKLEGFIDTVERNYKFRRQELSEMGYRVDAYPETIGYGKADKDQLRLRQGRTLSHDRVGGRWNYTTNIKDLGPDKPTAEGSNQEPIYIAHNHPFLDRMLKHHRELGKIVSVDQEWTLSEDELAAIKNADKQ